MSLLGLKKKDMIQNKRNYGGTLENFFEELAKQGLLMCFIENNRSFFYECYELKYTPKDAIEQYKKTNKIF